jgi:6-pyruvoyltetrahydropterin/6-carboxytetrahydropterin synthase
MYTLSVSRSFIAQHYLTVPDAGPENEWHSHHFQLDLVLEGSTLNEHGYLIDIVDVEQALDTQLDRYRDATLNDLPEFEGLNPSIEHFSRIMCTSIRDHINTSNINTITAKVWEDETSWASYQCDDLST